MLVRTAVRSLSCFVTVFVGAASGPLGPSPLTAPDRSTDCPVLPRTAAPAAATNDNRASAGTLIGDTLVVHLVVRPVTWYPEGRTSCGVPVLAFAEEGKVATVPGPLLRVRRGTTVRATVRNAAPTTVWLRGMQDHLPPFNDTVAVPSGATRELRFRATAVGAFLYVGRTILGKNLYFDGDERGGQLAGALVVDSSGASRVPQDRVLVLTRWADSMLVDSDGERFELNAINGRVWPLTERLMYTVGDTARWRVLSATGGFFHVMHLHGFYFRIDAQGALGRDSILSVGERPNAVSVFLGPLSEASITWVPDRPGNWLFHCHLLQHITAAQRLPHARPRGAAPLRVMGVGFPSSAEAEPARATAVTQASDMSATGRAPHQLRGAHAAEAMSGLVLGVTVRPRRGAVLPVTAMATRALRLYADMAPPPNDGRARFGFVLQDGDREPAVDSLVLPGSPLVLAQGEPTRITLVNRLDRPLSVHWHGLEIESYYDGVSGWSGTAGHLAPAIAPGDSFVVHLTATRPGTFMYHTHGETGDELALGLYGPLIVLPRGASWERDVDRLVMIADNRGVGGPTLVNGTPSPAPWMLRVGTAYRFRFMDIARGTDHDVTLFRGTNRVTWRMIARDGADLPPALATEEPAMLRTGPGMTYDVVFTPADTGRYALAVRTVGAREPPVVIPLLIR